MDQLTHRLRKMLSMKKIPKPPPNNPPDHSLPQAPTCRVRTVTGGTPPPSSLKPEPNKHASKSLLRKHKRAVHHYHRRRSASISLPMESRPTTTSSTPGPVPRNRIRDTVLLIAREGATSSDLEFPGLESDSDEEEDSQINNERNNGDINLTSTLNQFPLPPRTFTTSHGASAPRHHLRNKSLPARNATRTNYNNNNNNAYKASVPYGYTWHTGSSTSRIFLDSTRSSYGVSPVLPLRPGVRR